LKKKLQAFTLKVSSSSERHLIGNSLREIEDALNELQRQVCDFDRAVEEYKQNLDMNVKLQQALEEVGYTRNIQYNETKHFLHVQFIILFWNFWNFSFLSKFTSFQLFTLRSSHY